MALVVAALLLSPFAGMVRNGSPRVREPVEVAAASSLADTLISLEKESWVAWKKRDGAFFDRFLSDDHVEVGASGIAGKKAVVSFVGSAACVVADYSVDHFTLTRIAPEVAALTYRATQTTTCGKVPVPSPVWVTSVFVRRGGKWANVIYQQTPIKA
jgi:hypothetical protein